MKVVLQRVGRARVIVESEIVAGIGAGLCLFVGVEATDTFDDVEALVTKVVGLRVFPDQKGKMNLSVADVGGEALVISQFTLLGDTRRGRRPSFSAAAAPNVAALIIDNVVKSLRGHQVPTSTGVFGAHMEVDLVNDGPVTLLITVRDGKAF